MKDVNVLFVGAARTCEDKDESHESKINDT